MTITEIASIIALVAIVIMAVAIVALKVLSNIETLLEAMSGDLRRINMVEIWIHNLIDKHEERKREGGRG